MFKKKRGQGTHNKWKDQGVQHKTGIYRNNWMDIMELKKFKYMYLNVITILDGYTSMLNRADWRQQD